MKYAKLFIQIILLAIATNSYCQSHIDTLTNKIIVQLVNDGIETQTIIFKIENSPCNFTTNKHSVLFLNAKMVPDAIIEAMIYKNELYKTINDEKKVGNTDNETNQPTTTIYNSRIENQDSVLNIYKVIEYDNGQIYSGQVQNNMKNGKGELQYTDGSSYSGNWKDDKMSGEGIIISGIDSAKYIGTFLNGQKHGRGIAYNKNGKIEAEYTYQNGVLNGPFKINQNGGLIKSTGTMVNGEIEGQGMHWLKDKETEIITIFEGEFKKSKMHNGSIIHVYPNGRRTLTKCKKGKIGRPITTLEGIPPPSPTYQPQSKNSISCEDIDFIGAFSISGQGIINDIYVATIRNRANYTKTVHLEWIDGYGNIKTASFDIKSGDKVDCRLGISTPGVRAPSNVQIAGCQ